MGTNDMDSERNIVAKLATLSVISNISLVILKIIVGLLTKSISILSEAIHSGIDLVAAIMALWSVRQAAKPADKHHPYGHGKIENISGTVEAILIFVAAVIIIYEAIKKILEPGELKDTELGIIIMLISAGVNLVISNQLIAGAKKYDSLALEADGWHLRTDVYTSAGVMAGLIVIKITGWSMLDPIIAIITALLIIKAAWDLTRRSFKDLLDAKLPEEEEELIKKIINDHYTAFINYHKFRSRKSGHERFIDLHLVMDGKITLKEAHDFCDHLEEDIKKEVKNCNVLIHMEPHRKKAEDEIKNQTKEGKEI